MLKIDEYLLCYASSFDEEDGWCKGPTQNPAWILSIMSNKQVHSRTKALFLYINKHKECSIHITSTYWQIFCLKFKSRNKLTFPILCSIRTTTASFATLPTPLPINFLISGCRLSGDSCCNTQVTRLNNIVFALRCKPREGKGLNMTIYRIVRNLQNAVSSFYESWSKQGPAV